MKEFGNDYAVELPGKFPKLDLYALFMVGLDSERGRKFNHYCTKWYNFFQIVQIVVEI